MHVEVFVHALVYACVQYSMHAVFVYFFCMFVRAHVYASVCVCVHPV